MNPKTLTVIRWGLHVLVATSLTIVVFMEYIWPKVMLWQHGQAYKQLTLECDQAMHSEVVLRAAQQSLEVTEQQAKLLNASADVELTVCHDYDKLRKRLLISGLTEDDLALLGLEALEVERITVKRMVEPHRMPRF
jgi:hypothetical protein